MKHLLLLTGAVCLFSFLGMAQKTRQTGWQPGMVALANGTVISGEVNYHFAERLLTTLDAQGKQQAFSPKQVLYFRFFDDYFEIDRVFASIPFENESGYTTEDFFEVLLWGKIAVFGRLTFFDHQTLSKNTTTAQGQVFKPRWVEYDYYFFHQGKMLPLAQFEKQVLPIMQDRKTEIASLIEEKKYRTSDLYDQLRIIEHYDKLHTWHPFDLRIFSQTDTASF